MARVSEWTSLLPGSRVYVHYGDEDNYWHERILLVTPDADAGIVATPDGDIYLEELIDYERWVVAGPRGGLPVAVRGMPVHRFGGVSAKQMEGLLRQGAALAASMAPPVPSFEPPPRASTLAPPPTAPAAEAASGIWYAAETRGPWEQGAVFTGAVLHAHGPRALGALADGSAILLSRDQTFGAAEDLRILPARDRTESRLASSPFRAEVDQLTESPIDGWTVQGPRTTRWLVQAISEHHGSPTARHFWWRHVLGLAAGDHGVDEHLFLSTLLEQGVVSDRYNISESLVFESISRRYQLWEEVYSAALAEADAGTGAEEWLDERRLFLGQPRARAHALICPELEKHVASRLAEESAVLKERRKGREEKQLARLPPGVPPVVEPNANAAGAGADGGRGGRGKGRGGRGR